MTAKIINFSEPLLKCSFCLGEISKDKKPFSNSKGKVICRACVKKCSKLMDKK